MSFSHKEETTLCFYHLLSNKFILSLIGFAYPALQSIRPMKNALSQCISMRFSVFGDA